MIFLRKFLFKLLGFERYLYTVSFIFLKTFYHKCYLKQHNQIRFLSQIVKKGDYCLDIGANLGYFSVALSHIVGEKGCILACEPIALYRKVLQKNLKKYALPNVTIVPFALGELHQKEITLHIPKVEGVVRHGRAKIGQLEEGKPYCSVSARMVNPLIQFQDIQNIHFIKCDVEGYEAVLIPLMLPLIQRHAPILEIEISELSVLHELKKNLQDLGYLCYFLKQGQLVLFCENMNLQNQVNEYYFVPKHASLSCLPPSSN